jgi:hypothetical protein
VLVERQRAENVTGLKLVTEDRELRKQLVGERPATGEGVAASGVGGCRSENAGMSSVMSVRTRHAEHLRVPTEGQSASG